MKKTIVVILGIILFLIGIALLIGSGHLTHIMCDEQQFEYRNPYEFVRAETAQGIQIAGRICAVFGGASILFGLFNDKRRSIRHGETH